MKAKNQKIIDPIRSAMKTPKTMEYFEFSDETTQVFLSQSYFKIHIYYLVGLAQCGLTIRTVDRRDTLAIIFFLSL